jgi:hypothetical protein
VTYPTGRWGLGIVSGVVLGFALGFLFVGQDDQPWGAIHALGMLLPVVLVGVLSSLGANVLRMRESACSEKIP